MNMMSLNPILYHVEADKSNFLHHTRKSNYEQKLTSLHGMLKMGLFKNPIGNVIFSRFLTPCTKFYKVA